MEVLYFAVWCRPFTQYWAVPPNSSEITFHIKIFVLIPSEQCSAATNHLITNAIFNISSDLIILSIPMPLLFKVRLPMKNKIILFIIFVIGAFTIVAAALNKYYSFTHPFGTEWTIWYVPTYEMIVIDLLTSYLHPLQVLTRVLYCNPLRQSTSYIPSHSTCLRIKKLEFQYTQFW